WRRRGAWSWVRNPAVCCRIARIVGADLKSARTIKGARDMIKKLFIASAALTLLVVGKPAIAHHSANAEFDTQKVEKATGTLTKVENLNPHGWWYFDVKGADGKVTQLKLETGGPGGLINQGLKVKQDLKIGDSYTV